jgi:gliding motility-associated-like protein
LDSAGGSCGSGKSELSIEPINTSLIPMNWDINTDLPLVVSSVPLNLSPLSIESRLFCPKYGNGCDLLKLKGPRVLCQLKDTAVYILHTDPSCPDSITWSYDSANISVLSKGSGGLTLNFNKEGSYLIKAGKSGCNTITDSILVTVGNKLSDVHLPEDTALCFGHNLVLDAGAGYNSYLWQDGSNTQSISVSTPGIYWVKLTSGNDCISTDTSRITGIVQLPAHFLAADTVICSYSSLLLQSLQSYSSYLWSTGETSSAIEVKTSGIYWLEAVDKNGCKGADTIRVITKNCPYGIYFPNAFTPNKDGHNDQFRPIVIGNPVKYHFNIYNRLGRRIFSTTDPKKGWDGQIGGADQETGTYIWTCSFQFGGEKENKEAGNFILIR